MKMPKWLKLQEKIDYSLFLLRRMYRDVSTRSPIDMMVHKATGWDKEQLKQAKKLIKNIDKWKKEFYELTSKES